MTDSRVAALARKWAATWMPLSYESPHRGLPDLEKCIAAAISEVLQEAEEQFADKNTMISSKIARARIAALRKST